MIVTCILLHEINNTVVLSPARAALPRWIRPEATEGERALRMEIAVRVPRGRGGRMARRAGAVPSSRALVSEVLTRFPLSEVSGRSYLEPGAVGPILPLSRAQGKGTQGPRSPFRQSPRSWPGYWGGFAALWLLRSRHPRKRGRRLEGGPWFCPRSREEQAPLAPCEPFSQLTRRPRGCSGWGRSPSGALSLVLLPRGSAH